MNFASLDFLVFLPLCLACWYFAHAFLSWQIQKLILIAFSLLFYFWWSIFYGVLFLGFCIFVHYAARYIKGQSGTYRKLSLVLMLSVPFVGLFFFKYLNFSVSTVAQLAGPGLVPQTVLNLASSVVLPIAISFTALQSSSYLIDVYREAYPPSESLTDTVLYQCFFAHLLAGPILRGNELLPYFWERPQVSWGFLSSNVRPALGLLAIGLFKKVCLADPIGRSQERMWLAPEEFGGGALWLSVFAYAFQIYYDFSAYTDICRGCGKLFGFEIVENFNKPYLAHSPQEFWRRWHMSLSRWVRDYLYVPLGGSREGRARTLLNLLLVMTVVGLWHGAAWNFVAWGAYNGLLIALTPILFPAWLIRNRAGKAISVAATFVLVCFGWVLFRASDLNVAMVYLQRLFDATDFLDGLTPHALLLVSLYMVGHIRVGSWSVRSLLLRGPWYLLLLFALVGLVFGIKDLHTFGAPFIYFRF